MKYNKLLKEKREEPISVKLILRRSANTFLKTNDYLKSRSASERKQADTPSCSRRATSVMFHCRYSVVVQRDLLSYSIAGVISNASTFYRGPVERQKLGGRSYFYQATPVQLGNPMVPLTTNRFNRVVLKRPTQTYGPEKVCLKRTYHAQIAYVVQTTQDGSKIPHAPVIEKRGLT